MFSTGSKLFVGATVVALASAIVFGIFTGGDTGWTATIGLVGATVAIGFLAGINFFVRDCNVNATASDATTASAAAQAAPESSMWPAIGAFGAGVVVVGLVTAPVVFKAGVVVLLAAIVEWMVQGWSERASSDASYNASIRKRLLHPLEFPVLGAVVLAIIIYSFSRIMLFVSKSTGPAVFAILAALVLVAGFIIASGASIKKSVIAGVCAISGLGLVSTGAVMAIDGEREIKVHETVGNDPAVCLSNEETKADLKSSQTIGAKSNLAATVVYKDGQLYAQVIGVEGFQTSLQLARSNPSPIMFRNLSDEPVRLSATLGAFETDTVVNGNPTVDKPITCTALVDPDGRQFLTLIYPKASLNSLEPYTLVVPGVEGASIEVVVP